MKTWKVRLKYGGEFIDVVIRANTEWKAKIRTVDKLKKERVDKFEYVCSVEQLNEKECEKTEVK